MAVADPMHGAGDNVVAIDTIAPDQEPHRRHGAPSLMEGIRPSDL